MELVIPKDIFNNPHPPQIFLCDTGKQIIGELEAYDVSLNGKWNSYSELSFSIDRQYTDILTGELKVNPLFDKAEGLRKVYVRDIGYFVIQDPDATFSDKDSKTLSCFSIEYETGTKYLENFYINAGTDESVEVTYWASQYGNDYYKQDNYYKEASGFNAYTRYYYKEYTDNDSYTYTEIQIDNADDYEAKQKDEMYSPLYVKSYPNVQFFNPTKPELSLLHLIFKKIPEWSIGTVDMNLWKEERKFEEERIAVYDFLMNEMSDTFKCVVEWDTIKNEVNFYEEAEDGVNEDDTIQTRFDTDIFISRENLANEINVKYSTDNIKTKLKVVGADDLDIRDINLGKNYIMDLSYYHTKEWMGQDLFEAYNKYLEAIEEYAPKYTEEKQKWVGVYHKWNDLMNAVPATNDVLMVGDEFTKLYCLYGQNMRAKEWSSSFQYYDDFECTQLSDPQPTSSTDFKTNVYYIINPDSQLSALKKKLKLFHVNEDLNATKKDNVLLTLKYTKENSNKVATLRIYNARAEDNNYSTNEAINDPDFKIKLVVTNSSTGEQNSDIYELSLWVKGLLKVDGTINSMRSLLGFKISSIGTLGAYLCLVKDETNTEVLEEYGINLLREKRDIYTAIFTAQTEGYMSKDGAVCIASDDPPEVITVGSRWLDTSGSSTVLKEWNGTSWENVETTNNKDQEDYARYKENYDKLQAVQKVLNDKEKKAQYLLNGYGSINSSIDLSKYEDNGLGQLYSNGNSLEVDMQRIAQEHFSESTITRKDMDYSLPLYTFTTSKYPGDIFAVYLNGTTPYVAYLDSRGVHQMKMDWMSQKTELSSFFTDEGQWLRLSPFIREDEFSDNNFLLTGYESEEERLDICNNLMKSANKEMKTLCQPSLEFSMSMGNILALPEFKSLIDQFQLGKFIRVHIRDGYVKRARLLEVNLKFDDLSDFSATFGNLITTRSEIDKHAELLKQAVTASKQVAKSASDWQKAVDKSNRLDKAINEGLKDAALSVASSNGQNITWDGRGILCRKKVDGQDDVYEDEQILITNNKIVGTMDGFETSKGVFGSYEYDGQKYYGVLAEAVIGGIIEGSEIVGGRLEIGGDGGKFLVHEDGSVEILTADNTPKYATPEAVQQIENARQFHTELVYSGSTIFNEPNQICTITCNIFKWDEDITETLLSNPIKYGLNFKWIRTSNSDDTSWNRNHQTNTSNKIIITNSDVNHNAQFYVEVTFDETQLS